MKLQDPPRQGFRYSLCLQANLQKIFVLQYIKRHTAAMMQLTSSLNSKTEQLCLLMQANPELEGAVLTIL